MCLGEMKCNLEHICNKIKCDQVQACKYLSYEISPNIFSVNKGKGDAKQQHFSQELQKKIKEREREKGGHASSTKQLLSR